jgi:squalene-hopene/tetraprenyl-beta-curcumene cyclase
MIVRSLQVVLFSVGVVVLLHDACEAQEAKASASQYRAGDIVISAATAAEPKTATFSLSKADQYLERGALAWTRGRKCVTCHTNGTYMIVRPALTAQLGNPNDEIRRFYVEELQELKNTAPDKLMAGTRPAQAIFIAAGLSEWDAHVGGTLSPETDEALRFMFSLQLESGTWGSLDCWPPFESSAYQEATVAAMAAATAPGWLKGLEDKTLQAGFDKLKKYLRETKPPHDYARVLLLWTASRMPGLLDDSSQQKLADVVWKHQREDGGWSMRTFAKPQEWGRGNRADKLRGEPDFGNPESDGHMTGLAVIALRDAGVSADDPRIQSAVKWLLTNQRESGRWWTRSLNTDSYHFITYSGTAYPLLALSKCGKLPARVETSSR